MSNSVDQKHILLSSVGISGPKETCYVHRDSQANALFSAFGLWQLLPQGQQPDEAWFLLTPMAKEKSWAAIKAEAARVAIEVRPIELSGDSDDTREFLEQTAAQLPRDCRLTLNVTEGLRHHAFLFYALALYLAEFRSIEIAGVWYCRLETDNRDDPKPLIDLKPVLELAKWFHAIASFRETGSLREIARRLPEGEPRKWGESLSDFFLNGMPIEAGDAAARLLDLVEDSPLISDVPLATELNTLLCDEIRELAGIKFESNPSSEQIKKRSIPISDIELKRQAAFIARYFNNGQLNLAFGLMREWSVTWIAHQRGEKLWLERSVRESIEHSLGGISEVIKAKEQASGNSHKPPYKHAAVRAQLTDDQVAWAKRWSSICDIRNGLQHHGMKPATFEPHRGDIPKAKSDWESWNAWKSPGILGGGKGRLLICPIGLTPGVLYSAVRHAIPDRVLVICSEQSAGQIDEALRQADAVPEVQQVLMLDIHRGVDEFAGLLRASSLWLYEADEIIANLTGGSTLMGVLANQFVARARREYQRPVRECVLIDPRQPEEQRSAPWHLGDIHFLDGEPPKVPDDSDTETGCDPRPSDNQKTSDGGRK